MADNKDIKKDIKDLSKDIKDTAKDVEKVVTDVPKDIIDKISETENKIEEKAEIGQSSLIELPKYQVNQTIQELFQPDFEKETLRLASTYYPSEPRFLDLNSFLNINNNSTNTNPVIIFDEYSYEPYISGIVPVPIGEELSITSYGWASVHNYLLDIDDKPFIKEPEKLKKQIKEQLNNLSEAIIVGVPSGLLNGIVGAFSKHPEKFTKPIIKIFEMANKLENRVVDNLVNPIFDLIVLIVNNLTNPLIPVIKTIVRLIDNTWLGQLIHRLVNIPSERPLNEMIAWRVILEDKKYEKECPPIDCECETQRVQVFAPENKIVGYKVKYCERVLGFRHNYTCNESIIDVPGYYVFELNCGVYANNIYVKGIYQDGFGRYLRKYKNC